MKKIIDFRLKIYAKNKDVFKYNAERFLNFSDL